MLGARVHDNLDRKSLQLLRLPEFHLHLASTVLGDKGDTLDSADVAVNGLQLTGFGSLNLVAVVGVKRIGSGIEHGDFHAVVGVYTPTHVGFEIADPVR